MNDNQDTQRIKRVLIEKFANGNNEYCYCYLQPEVSVGNRKRVDLGGYEYIDMEADASIGIEVKVSQSDFYSGYGRNFDFEWNYLAVPTELVSLAIRMLRRWHKGYVGVIEVDSRSNVNILKHAVYMPSRQGITNPKGYSYSLGWAFHERYVDNEWEMKMNPKANS